jgi:transcriptional regulator with XRE-family HTH domain
MVSVMAKKPTVSDATNEEARRIGARVAKLRDRLKLTNDKIGAQIGVTGDAVKKIVDGSSATQYAKLKRLAEVLETTPNDLLGVSGERDDLEEVFDAFECALEMVDFDPIEAKQLSLLVREALKAPLTPSSRQNPILARRILIEAAIQQFFSARPRKGPDA